MPYGLIIPDGLVIGPGIHVRADVAIAGGRVVALGAGLGAAAWTVVDAAGAQEDDACFHGT